jgi:hypothetical protein
MLLKGSLSRAKTESPRDGWSRLLKLFLMGDPSQSRGERCDEFLTHRGLIVGVWSGQRRYQGSQFDLGNKDYLILTRMIRWKQWKIRWEKISKIDLQYTEAPSAKFLELIRMGRQPCDERRLGAEKGPPLRRKPVAPKGE